MSERPTACPVCGGTVLIRSGHTCGRQRWRCKGCGRQFTRTTPRGKSAGMKAAAVELYCTGLSLSAVGKRLGVSSQSVMRWIRDHARRHCPKPEPVGRGIEDRTQRPTLCGRRGLSGTFRDEPVPECGRLRRLQ